MASGARGVYSEDEGSSNSVAVVVVMTKKYDRAFDPTQRSRPYYARGDWHRVPHELTAQGKESWTFACRHSPQKS